VWWLEPQWIYPLWTGSSLVLLGIAWPIVLDRLIRAGYGRRSDTPPVSLWQRLREAREERARRATSAAADPLTRNKPAADPRGLSAEELARLEAMEAGLRDFAVTSGTSPDDSGAPIEPTPVRELRGGPLDTQTDEKPKEQKAYGGEFYPTVAHARRKPGEDEPPAEK
jgi:hypothetical protein